MVSSARPMTWIVAGSSSCTSVSVAVPVAAAPPYEPPNMPCSMTKTWCRIRKCAHRSASVATASQVSSCVAAVRDERGPAG